MSAEALAAYAFATVLQLPFHLIFGLPWFLAAWVAWRLTSSFRRTPRAAIIAILIGTGLATVYGFHASMFPAYIVLISEQAFSSASALSIAITCILVFAIVLWLTKPNSNAVPVQSNP
jgi:hypothetical protein